VEGGLPGRGADLGSDEETDAGQEPLMPHTLPAVITHVRAAKRPQSHGAILVREIERLRAILSACTCVNHDFEGVVCRAVEHAETTLCQETSK
jgi:hypothetical protein